MGILFAIVDDGRRVYLDLGKSYGISQHFTPERRIDPSKYDSAADYEKACRDTENEAIAFWKDQPDALKAALIEGTDDGEVADYWRDVAEHIYNFCASAGWQNLRFLADTSDSYYEVIHRERPNEPPPYRCAGSIWNEREPLEEVAEEKLGAARS